MSSDLAKAGESLLGAEFDLTSLVEHSLAVEASRSVEAVYGIFREHDHEFAAVVEDGRYVGMVSRGHVGFLLGARFGFALYAREPVSAHLIEGALTVNRGMGLMAVFDRTLSRAGKSFYDDVALLDGDGDYLGMIPVRRLIGVQSDIISHQSHRSAAQQAELAEKNKQLFRSLNELRQSQGRYDALLKNSALGIALLNNDGRVEVCNPRTEALIGPIPEEDGAARRNLAEWLVPGQREAFLDLLRRHEAETGAALSSEREFTVRTANRGERLFRFFTTWIVETGQVCVQFHDVTEHRFLERQAALHEKSALFESLVGGIAHELNNKLSPVLGYADLLSESLGSEAPGSETTEFCATIRNSTVEAAKIIRQLLQLSRPPAVEMSLCDLSALVSEARDMLIYRLRATATEFHWIPPGTPVCVMADPSQIKQVLFNLMLNAMDAMETAPRKQIRVNLCAEGARASLTVSDTGHGIAPEHMSRVFDPFFTTKSPDRGTGLGLSVCLSIVRQHRGEISVESRVGVGTAFCITIPIAADARAASRPDREARQGELSLPDTATSRQRIRAMVVDDEPYVTALIQELLRRHLGWQAECVGNGRLAIKRLEQDEAFDLLISDVRMPEVDGLALYEWMRTNRPGLAARTIFVTGDAGSADLTRTLHDLGRPVLYKPFNAGVLIEQCRRTVAPV